MTKYRWRDRGFRLPEHRGGRIAGRHGGESCDIASRTLWAIGWVVINGEAFTVSVNVSVTFDVALLAVMMIGKENVLPPTAGMPASVAVPLPLSVSLTPVGNVPV